MTTDIDDIRKKMEHREKLSKFPLCLQCEFDASIYGAAFHHEEKGHIPFEEAVKIIIYTIPQPAYHGKSVLDYINEIKGRN